MKESNVLVWRASLALVVLVALLAPRAAARPSGPGARVTTREIATGVDHNHCTTRQFQHQTFHHRGVWFVFYSDGAAAANGLTSFTSTRRTGCATAAWTLRTAPGAGSRLSPRPRARKARRRGPGPGILRSHSRTIPAPSPRRKVFR